MDFDFVCDSLFQQNLFDRETMIPHQQNDVFVNDISRAMKRFLEECTKLGEIQICRQPLYQSELSMAISLVTDVANTHETFEFPPTLEAAKYNKFICFSTKANHQDNNTSYL